VRAAGERRSGAGWRALQPYRQQPTLVPTASFSGSVGKVNKVMSIYQLVVKGRAAGASQLRNIHHYEFPNYVPDEDQVIEAVQAVADAYEEILLGAFPGSVTFEAFDVRRVDIGDQPTAEIIPAGWPVAGSAAGSQFPPQVSALVVWKAPTAFPRSTRTYLFPFVVTAGSPTGTLTLTWRTAIATFQLALEELDITGDPPAQKVAVRYGGDPRVVVASNLVSAAPVDSVFATQRSRRYGVGI